MISPDSIELDMILDSLPMQIAVIDRKGTIIQVNASWRSFSEENAAAIGENYYWLGANYFDAWAHLANRQNEDLWGGESVSEGIRRVLEGKELFFSLDYSAQGRKEQRWFMMSATPLQRPEGGAVIMHIPVTHHIELQHRLQYLGEQIETRVRERTAKLRKLARALTLAENRERQLLAQDLYDNLGQLLALMRIKLSGIKNGANVESILVDIDKLINLASNSLRSLAYQLSPPILFELGLRPAVEWLAEEVGRLYGLRVSVQEFGEDKPLDQPSRAILFSVLRDLLLKAAINVARSGVVVSFMGQENRLSIWVCYKNIDLDAEQFAEKSGIDLFSLRERLGFIGGNIEISSVPGKGSVVSLLAPLLLDEGEDCDW